MRSGDGGRHHARHAAPAEPEGAQKASLLAAIIDPDGGDALATASPMKLFDATVPRPRTESSAHISGELPVDELGAPDETPAPSATPRNATDAVVPAVARPEARADDDTDTMPAVAEETLEEDIEVEPVELADGHPLKRTKVTLSPPAKRHDEVRVYIAPPPDGLGKFDLGTVPASVTPPRTWRKAAWFAAMSSGGVVVALLVAGSYLVGTPPEQVAIENWPGLQVEPPYLFDGSDEETSQRRASTRADRTSDRQRIADLAGVQTGRPLTSLPAGDAGTPSSAPGSPTATGTPTTTASAEPSKPPPEPAERETETPPFGFYPNAETMGDRSERFLNAITENPDAAHQETGGELYAEGADGVAEAYSEIAYFEVEHIYIDQRNRQTINSVTVVWKDGSTTSEQRTLKFEDGDKITDDGTD